MFQPVGQGVICESAWDTLCGRVRYLELQQANNRAFCRVYTTEYRSRNSGAKEPGCIPSLVEAIAGS